MDLSEATYVVFDVETTGLSAIYNDLIQVSVVKADKGCPGLINSSNSAMTFPLYILEAAT